MKASYLPDLLTPLDFWEAHGCMVEGLRRHTGKFVDDDAVALALAKTALETGRWKSIHRYNFGNIKAGEAYEGHYTAFRCNEVLGGKVVWFDPTTDGWALPPAHPQTRFRAHQAAAEGAEAYCAFVSGGRYAKAWMRLLDGDEVGFVGLLKQAGYFTADEAAYLKGVRSLKNEFLARLAMKSLPDTTPEVLREACACINDEDRARIEWLWHDTMTAIFDDARADARAHILNTEE